MHKGSSFFSNTTFEGQGGWSPVPYAGSWTQGSQHYGMNGSWTPHAADKGKEEWCHISAAKARGLRHCAQYREGLEHDPTRRPSTS
jgi:hypothetical protein